MENELKRMKSEYENSYTELSEIKSKIVRFEFSKGGDVFFRGLYTPYMSFRYGLFSNSPGRMIKTDKNFTFKYGFNEKNQLVYVLRNLDGIYTEEYILHLPACEIGLCFDKRMQLLTDITVCKYNNGLLMSVHHANIMDWINYFSFSFTEEVYQYQEGILTAMEERTGDTKYPTRFHKSYEIAGKDFKLVKQWVSK